MRHRIGQVPHRDVTSRITFSRVDEEATARARQRAAGRVVAIYNNDPGELLKLKARVINELNQLAGAESLATANRELWAAFSPQLAEGTPEPTEAEREQQFTRFKESMAEESAIEKLTAAIDIAFADLERNGLLEKLPDEGEFSSESIEIRKDGEEAFATEVKVTDVLLATVTEQLRVKLEQQMPSLELATRVFARLRTSLPPTLTRDEQATRKAQEVLVAAVETQYQDIARGAVLAPAELPIDKVTFALLTEEQQAVLAERSFHDKVMRSTALLGMYLALYILCGTYISRHEPKIIDDLSRFATLLGFVAVTVGMMLMTFANNWQAEVIPLLIFAMTVTIAYQQPLALLLSASVTLMAVIGLGLDFADAVILMATSAGAILVLDNVRTRSKLLMVGIVAAVVVFFTTLGVGTLMGDPFAATLQSALRYSLWAVIAGFIMTGILPAVEKLFNVQTDLSLLELGDPAHQLLQELVRRAPGTYNHSINVASLAESAAESIGARGLLVRVGAYFHDIGKMLKPGYFIENQGTGGNRHDTLVPAMSTLVIIAHVKDGADLARQHRLPEAIIDFIQQHHGTTLVEYFYRQATDRRQLDPNSREVDESAFRYPGPKPQTKEAGVLMLADAVESASRVLVEPTPARIESLVEDITRKKLLDGQFDECGLTLEEVRRIGDSLVKSLTAVYHGRVKYPDQVTA